MKQLDENIVKLSKVSGRAGIVLLFFVCIFCLSPSAAALDIPKLQGYVNDYADMISPETKKGLEAELQHFEATDSTQIVVLTVPSLEGEDLEGFSIRVADAWKIGQKLKDNGVVFLVAKEEKKIRIEVGRGLEGRLTDLMAGRIIDLVVKPRFKRGDFNGGVTAGIQALIDGTRGEFTAVDSQRAAQGRNPSEFLSFLVFGLVFVLVLGNISRVFGAATGALGLPILVSSFFSVGGLVLALLGAFGLLIGLALPFLFSSAGHSRRGGTSWPGGGFGGGFGSGGGFGGGGFSGGGGGFGGGGASGGW